MDEDIFWGDRNPQEAEALICLVEAEFYLSKAILDDSTDLYSKALEFSEKVIEYLPSSAIAHFISAFARLRALGDRDYAQQKYELLQSFQSEEANELAQKLKEEMEVVKGSWGKPAV